MSVTVQINTNSPVGQRIVTQLRRHPKVVRFVETEQIAASIPEGFVSIKDGFEDVRNHIKSLYKSSIHTK